MSKLDDAIKRIRKLPPERQDDFAQDVTRMLEVYEAEAQEWDAGPPAKEGEYSEPLLSPEDVEELRRRAADPNPQYASDEEVEALFNRYRK